MATLATLTLDIEDMLFGIPQVERPVEDTLNTAVTNASDVAWRFDTYQLWKRGEYAEYLASGGTAGEIVIFAADHASAQDVTVRRAQKRTSAAAHTAIGTATYDETGGAQEDLWTTSAAHGKSVGDQVVFSAAGGGATGYAANTTYYVASVPLTTTLTLSATSGGSAIEGTGDSTGTWTMVTPAYTAGSVFRRNPLWDRTMIQRAINETVDSDLAPEVFYRNQRSLTLADGKLRYDLTAADFEVEFVYQADLNSASVGAATFDVTGGASEDLWSTSSAHGLAVGDAVRFSAVGTGAEPYAVNTVYWVAAVPSTTTFQLSATDSTTVLEGTGTDSVGTWTLVDVGALSFNPLPRAYWEVVNVTDTAVASATGRTLRLKHWYKTDHTLYYTARTKPSSSAISSLPTEIADMIPYGAMARLLTWAAVPARSDVRRSNRIGGGVQAGQPLAESAFYAAKFEDMKKRYKRLMMREFQPYRNYRTDRVWRG